MPGSRSALMVALAWAVAALVLGGLVQARHVASIGSLEGALRVGAESPARPFIESDLGPVPLTEGLGHDGYWFYLSAVDPMARDLDRHSAYIGYRHRRLLGPLIAGVGGVLPPQAALNALNVLGIAGFGLSAGAAAWIGFRRGGRPWAALGALLSIGLWLSVQLLTADTLTIGLALLAVALALTGRWGPAVAVMVSSVLAKETSMLFALGLAGWAWAEGRRRHAMAMLVVPAAALGAWLVYLESVLGGAFASNDNLTWPLAGMIQSLPDLAPGADRLYGWLAVAGIVIAVGAIVWAKDHLITALLAPWVVMAVVSSSMVWDNGNNALRVFAPCFVVGVLGLAVAVAKPRSTRPAPAEVSY